MVLLTISCSPAAGLGALSRCVRSILSSRDIPAVGSMVVSTTIVSLTMLVRHNVVVGRGRWRFFNLRMEARLLDCCRSTRIRVRRENGGFMLSKIRFVVRTLILVSNDCRGVGFAGGSSGKNPGCMIFINESMGTRVVRRRNGRCSDIGAVVALLS